MQNISDADPQARRRFLELAQACGSQVESHTHPLKGPAGAPLAMDVARIGPARASCVLLTARGMHGVEGHVGGGIQSSLLAMPETLKAAAGPDTAIVHVHAVNPDYAALDAMLLPPEWPPNPEGERRRQEALAALGPRRAQLAITKGQHTPADGMYFGGIKPTWRCRAFGDVLRRHTSACRPGTGQGQGRQAATPGTVVDRINAAMNAVLQNVDVRKGLEGTGSNVAAPLKRGNLDRLYASEIDHHRTMAKGIHLTPQ